MRIFSLTLLVLASICATAQQDLPTHVPTEGLRGWWPFTGNASDRSGNGNHGLTVSAQLAADRFGNPNSAYRFNGNNSYIEVADAASLRVRYISIAAWVKCYNLNRINQIVYKGSIQANGEQYALTMTENGKYHSSVKIGSNCQTAVGWAGGGMPENTITDSSWNHLVATYDGSVYSLYKNGVLDSSFPVTGPIDSCINGQLRFGFDHLRYFASTGNPMDGIIDDIGIWNRALTPAEIGQLYNASASDCGYGKLGVNICNPKRNLHVKDVLRLEPRTTAPDNPEEGDIYYDSILHKLRVYDGTGWQNCW